MIPIVSPYSTTHCSMNYSFSLQYDASQVMFSSDSASTSLLTLLPQYDDGDSSTHLAMVRAGESSPTFLTGPGPWEVTDIIGHEGDTM